MATLLTFLSSAFGKLLAGIGLILFVVAYVFLKGQSRGKRVEKERQAKAIKQIEDKWDEIETRDLPIDDAFDKLRDRASRHYPKT